MTTLVAAGLLIIALVTTAAWAMPALARPSLPFGVRVPPHRTTDQAIIEQRRIYTRRVLGLGALGLLASVPLILIRGPEPMLILIPAVLVVADAVAYYLAHREVRAAKSRGNWYAGSRQGTIADTTLRTDPVRVPWAWLAPAVLVLIATAAVGITRYGELPATLPAQRGMGVDTAHRMSTTWPAAFAPVLVQAALTLLMPLLAAGLTRARPELDAARPAGSARRYRAYLTGVVRLIMSTTACANLTALVIALQLWEILPPSVIVTVVTYLPLGLALAAWIVFEFRVGQAGHRLPAEPGEEAEDSTLVQRDDDRYWRLGGFVYANRTDPALFVHQRAGGANWTMNLGHPITWAVLATLLVIALLSATGIVPLTAG
ncbi:DUF1648 domain-containing protein [Streptosporangium sp. NBC_01469]|uniref:DUF1648 domain-containing protein n=1 Tax=Streptosporangium sp. NBC_01469 TaxID=2903898 RepID=UPI002E2D24D4|nr:hypothetical protein [Streptosporangium sp. NBC_01469]